MKTELRHTIDLLSNEYELVKLFNALSEKGAIVFFGGFPRDNLLYEYERTEIRDLDIVFIPKRAGETDLSALFGSINMNYQKNRYDGFKLKQGDLTIDIWELEKTWAFQHSKKRASFENLVETTYSSFDSIAYNYSTDELLDYVLNQTVKNKTVELVMSANPDVELNILKNLIQVKKYGWKKKQQLEFSPAMIREFLNYYRSVDSLEGMYQRQSTRYGEEYYTLLELNKQFELFEQQVKF